MYNCIDLNNEMLFLDNNIADMKKAATITELTNIYNISQRRLSRIFVQNQERINLFNSVIQDPQWLDMIKEVEE